MPDFPDEIRAKDGRPIVPAYHALETWVDNYPVHGSGAGLRTRQYPGQTMFRSAPRAKRPRTFFRVSVAGTEAQVGAGAVNFEIPRMGEEGLTLEGLDKDGRDTGRLPALELLPRDNGGPGEDGRSFICLRILCDPKTAEPLKEALPLDWLTVVHRPALPFGSHFGGVPGVLEDDVNAGYEPLAVLYWDPEGRTVRRWFPFVMHNLKHRLTLGEPDETGDRGLGRHWFLGAT